MVFDVILAIDRRRPRGSSSRDRQFMQQGGMGISSPRQRYPSGLIESTRFPDHEHESPRRYRDPVDDPGPPPIHGTLCLFIV